MTSNPLHQLSPGQRVAWYRIRRGVSQEVLAGLVGRTADWLGKIENDRAPLDRLSVIRLLADALDVSVIDLIGDIEEGRNRDRRSLQVEAVRSVSLGVWIGSGSRDEEERASGVSHFIEHLLFKGSERYTAQEIAEIFDGLGGELNAATSREHTVVYARVPDEHLATAVDVMAEMVFAPSFADLDSEREVVLEEIAMYEDEPQDKVHDVLASAVFGDHPLGRPIIGRAEVISSVPVPTLAAYHDGRYVAANIGTTRHTNRRDGSVPLAREVVVAPSLGRGASVSYQARFNGLMDVIRSVHGGLGVQVAQDGTDLVFDVVEPADRSASATFSFGAKNLRRCRWNRGFPEVTHVVVAGQGEGTARNFRQRSDPTTANSWRMVSRIFKDQRHTDDATELDQAGDEELERARRHAILEAELIDTARLSYGTGYRLGDTVTVSPEPGVFFTDQITEVRIRADADSGDVTITPVIGWDTGPYATRRDRQIDDATRRIGNLERSL
jgi:transcriptional regulator with XRE-family HTH domain